MSVTLKSNEDKDPNKITSEYLFFIALNLCVLPFSGYQTYMGYTGILKNPIEGAGLHLSALAVAVISSVFFAAMNWGIRERRMKGEKHHWQVMMYIVPLVISLAGNFNAFYGQQMKGPLVEIAVKEVKGIYEKNYAIAISPMDSISDKLTGLYNQYNALTTEMSDHYYSTDSGWGANVESRWQEVKSVLEPHEKYGSTIMPPNKKGKYAIAEADTFAGSFFQKIKNQKLDPINSCKADIVGDHDQIGKNFRDEFKTPQNFANKGCDFISKMEESNSNMVSQACLRSFDLNFSEIPFGSCSQIGTLLHTIRSAFIRWDDPVATIFSSTLSLILDLSALFYLLLFVPYNKSSGRINQSGPTVM